MRLNTPKQRREGRHHEQYPEPRITHHVLTALLAYNRAGASVHASRLDRAVHAARHAQAYTRPLRPCEREQRRVVMTRDGRCAVLAAIAAAWVLAYHRAPAIVWTLAAAFGLALVTWFGDWPTAAPRGAVDRVRVGRARAQSDAVATHARERALAEGVQTRSPAAFADRARSAGSGHRVVGRRALQRAARLEAIARCARSLR